nr:uncharacterized protein LOC106731670 [Pelodiscus sinensis]|eukprot:XP_014426726.1 uncharacterized protein LOC106731670 [Pelodiscus sinensis]
MLLSLFLLLFALSPSSQEICSAPGALPASILYLSQTSARPEGSVRLQCSIVSGAQATRIVFCKDGEEASSQPGSLGKLSYDFDHVVSRGSSGNYSCGYEIKGSDNHVTRSQLSPAQHLSVTDDLPAPILYLSQTSVRPGDSVQLQCSVFSWVRATRIIFYKDGEEVLSQMGLKEKITYDYVHLVSRGSSGQYSCGYEIKDSESRAIRSQLSPAQHLSVTGDGSSSGGAGVSSPPGLALSPAIWAARCILVLLLLVSAPIITFVLDKQGLPKPAGPEEACGGSGSISGEGDNGGASLNIYE